MGLSRRKEQHLNSGGIRVRLFQGRIEEKKAKKQTTSKGEMKTKSGSVASVLEKKKEGN